ncbi:transient receptor potential cation channel subfamily A member 1 [Tachyglossus aculeatus]|uniref:transient receptor potential cation channel subfamily A member 1 n=1 Tax=Tachyglossus aculeatus TaxID=9261 RepID=UPI0018F7741E|nr:transient receptor potential cation channel subfamily A member 1 [Tachyglossus aculeatus]
MKPSGRPLQRAGQGEPQAAVCQGLLGRGGETPARRLKVVSDGGTPKLRTLVQETVKEPVPRDQLDATPLHHAAGRGQLDQPEVGFHHATWEELNAMDACGNTPLHWAARQNQVQSVRLLLGRGADPNLRNHSCMAPLHLAVQACHNDVVKALLQHPGTDVDLEGENGNSAIMFACHKDNSEALQLLVDRRAKACKSNKWGYFPIHLAAFSGARKCMDIMLEYGEKEGFSRIKHINFLNHTKSSPLHLAVQSGDLEMIQKCLEHGAQVDLEESGKCTALHFAATQGSTEIVKLMITYAGDDRMVNAENGNKETLLHRASLFDHYDLAEYLISKGANIDSIDCEGRSPLLLATASASWNIVNLLLAKGANVEIKDNLGRNFLHLAVLQHHGLNHLRQEFLQMQSVKALVKEEDVEGCTPLHYACRKGVPLSVNNLLCLNESINSKSKDKKSPLHFAAKFGRINTCKRLLRDVTDSRLLNEGDQDGMTPLHLAAKNGHDKVVQYLLKKGALFLSDHRGRTALHHAALGGYTQTLHVILDNNLKCTDQLDEDGNTALHLASQEGHAKATSLLLNSGAQIILNKNMASFLHEAIHSKRKDVVITAIRNPRWEECFKAFTHLSPTNRCPVLEMVEHLPECMKMLLDTCIVDSSEEKTGQNFYIQYNFRYLQCPLEYKKKAAEEKNIEYEPLVTLNSMVRHNRIELLSHPVCKEYLLMKWMAYGFRAHIMNLALYCLGLIPLTLLVINIKPGLAFNSTGIINATSYSSHSLDTENSHLIKVCMILVFLTSVLGLCKELIQLYQQRLSYLSDQNNWIEWLIYSTSLVFVSPLFLNVPADVQWQCGAIAVHMSWMNFLLYLQRFENFGIYIVILWEIMRTLFRTTVVFFSLILSFGLSFYILLGLQRPYGTPALSIMRTFAMMLGDINYQEGFLQPYLDNSLPYPFLSFLCLINFTFLMPILLMNLLIGLAVGDIAEVQKYASLKRIAMQVELHTNLEKKLPFWFLNKVDQISVRVHPNRPRYFGIMSLFQFCFSFEDPRQDLPSADNVLETEVLKQKYRLKDLSSLLEKQHELIKLIIQKMEITSEMEEEDSGVSFQDRFRRQQLEQRNSRWTSVLQAVKSKGT